MELSQAWVIQPWGGWGRVCAAPWDPQLLDGTHEVSPLPLMSRMVFVTPGKDGEVLPLRSMPEHLVQLKSKVGLSRAEGCPRGVRAAPTLPPMTELCVLHYREVSQPHSATLCSRGQSTSTAAVSHRAAAGSPTPLPPASSSTACGTRVTALVL